MTATSAVETGDDEGTAAAPATQPAPRPGPQATPQATETATETARATAEDADGLGLPFAWEHGPHVPDAGERGRRFRFPAADDPEPGSRRLLAMSLYTALLGLLALAVTVSGLLTIAGGAAPGWYQPAFAAAGLVGVGCVVGAFLSIHRPRTPWLLLACAAVPLAANIVMTLATP
jgi:hypothetical protein